MTKAQKSQTTEAELATPRDPADDPELQAAVREFEEQEAKLAEMQKRLTALDAEVKQANDALTAVEDDEQDALDAYAETGDTKALDKVTAKVRAAQAAFIDLEKRRAAVQGAIQARKPELLAAENRLTVAKTRYWQAREQAALERVREVLPLIAECYWCHQGALDSSEPIYTYLHDPARTLGLTQEVLDASFPTGPVPLRRVASRFIDGAERFNIHQQQRHQTKEVI